MSLIIAVENNLRPVREYLSSQGCQVIPVENASNTEVNAVVLSGMDENIMGIQDTVTKAPVIRASGRTPEDIWNEIQRRG